MSKEWIFSDDFKIKFSDKLFNDFHRKNSEASQKEVQTMLKRPYSLQEVKEQVDEFKKDGEWIRTVQSRNYNKTS